MKFVGSVELNRKSGVGGVGQLTWVGVRRKETTWALSLSERKPMA
jgi:hypothetical protein